MRLAVIGGGGLARRHAERSAAMGARVVALQPAVRGAAAGADASHADAASADAAAIAVELFGDREGLERLLLDLAPEVITVLPPHGRDEVGPTELVVAASSVATARLVVWGSGAAYRSGRDGDGSVFDESSPTSARRPNAAAAADAAVVRLTGVSSRPVHLFRAARVVGAGRGPGFDLGRLRVVPTPSRHRYLQVLDVRDALEILERAVAGASPGVYNACADGIVKVSDVCRAHGRGVVRLPGPLWLAAVQAARWSGRVGSAPELRALTAGTPILDNTRLKTHFGFRPRFTARDALAACRDEGAPGARIIAS